MAFLTSNPSMKPDESGCVSVTVTIPDKQPYEGKATLKQKQRIWELGYRNRESIDALGKQQASAIISQLSSAHVKYSHRRSAKRYAIAGVCGFIIAGILAATKSDSSAAFGLLLFLGSSVLIVLSLLKLIRG